MRVYRWFIEDMDVNGDGDVTGPDEGIPVTVERGDFGFTAVEEDIVMDSFEVWEDVPTSFIGMRYTTPIIDPAGIFTGLGTQDGLNLIAAQVPGDPVNSGIAFPILGITFVNFFLEDGFQTSPDGTMTYEVQGTRILEADIVIEMTSHRGANPIADLKGTVVHEAGHWMGIGHNPMSNLAFDATLNTNVETAVYAQPDATGALRRVGVTPTMFPSVFITDDGAGNFVGGYQDLSPADIGVVSFLYPRTDQSAFFSIRGEARTQSRAQIPSTPLLGSLVTAWADVDNNPSTPRVPFMATMTGLYTPSHEISNRGQFVMPGLLREFIGFGDGASFQATYTFTLAPINPTNQLGSGTEGPAGFDSMHSPLGDGTQWTIPYDTIVQTETFFADGELFGEENREAGTALAWDPLRGQVVDPVSGRTFASMVANDTPMFGDKSEVCPLLVIEQELGVAAGPNLLRGFRDRVLLQSAAGVVVVDAYYQAGPAMARMLREKPLLLKVFGLAALFAEWLLTDGSFATLLSACALTALALVARKRRRAAVAAALAALAIFGFLAGPSAHAAIYPVSENELISLADSIVEGTVASVESRIRDDHGGIVTTVGITVNDNLKGSLNKQSTVYIDLPYGRVGNYVVRASETPTYAVGEEAILFLREGESGVLIPLGGTRGKHAITTSSEDGEQYVVADFVSQHHMKQVSKSVLTEKGVEPDEAELKPYVKLDDYKAFVRSEVRKQR